MLVYWYVEQDNRIMNKTILVTGGLGYLGSYTVVALQNNTFNVVVDDLSKYKNQIKSERRRDSKEQDQLKSVESWVRMMLFGESWRSWGSF